MLTELLLFGPQVAAEAAGVPYVVLNPTINVVPAPGVPAVRAGVPARRRPTRTASATGSPARWGWQAWDAALPALNAARAEQGLEPLEHVLDQGRSAALILVLTSAAFDLADGLPPVVKHVGPRLDDPDLGRALDGARRRRPARARRAELRLPESGRPAAADRRRRSAGCRCAAS